MPPRRWTPTEENPSKALASLPTWSGTYVYLGERPYRTLRPARHRGVQDGVSQQPKPSFRPRQRLSCRIEPRELLLNDSHDPTLVGERGDWNGLAEMGPLFARVWLPVAPSA